MASESAGEQWPRFLCHMGHASEQSEFLDSAGARMGCEQRDFGFDRSCSGRHCMYLLFYEIIKNIYSFFQFKIIIIYFTLDIYFWEKYTRFTFSPYIQLIIAFSGK